MAPNTIKIIFIFSSFTSSTNIHITTQISWLSWLLFQWLYIIIFFVVQHIFIVLNNCIFWFWFLCGSWAFDNFIINLIFLKIVFSLLLNLLQILLLLLLLLSLRLLFIISTQFLLIVLKSRLSELCYTGLTLRM